MHTVARHTRLSLGLIVALVAAPSAASALEPIEIYFRAMQSLINHASFDREALHAEVKRRSASCHVRIVLHHARLEDSERPDGTIDLDFTNIAADDIVAGQRTVDDDSPRSLRHVVHITPTSPAAAALFDGRRRGHVGADPFPHLYVTARVAGGPVRDVDLRDELERDATALLERTLRDFADACREAAPTPTVSAPIHRRGP